MGGAAVNMHGLGEERERGNLYSYDKSDPQPAAAAGPGPGDGFCSGLTDCGSGQSRAELEQHPREILALRPSLLKNWRPRGCKNQCGLC